jgi:dextranase
VHACVRFSSGIEVCGDSAIDRGNGPVRYGFLSDFSPQDADTRALAIDFLLANHITHVQFYDWSFRPHQYRPALTAGTLETTVYRDTMGKTIDLKVVRDLIAALHSQRMLALGYGAVYAATEEYLQNHPEQALYDREGHPIDLIGKFFIMNCAEQGPWCQRILDQYRYAVEQVGFDGIHMDTYGFPKSAWDSAGNLVNLCTQFVSLIDAWASHGDVNIFNNVGGWPAEATGQAAQAAVYIEVWDPHTKYRHIRQLIKDARRSAKPVVLAAYLEPFKHRTNGTLGALRAYQLLSAAICAYGATHLIFGERGAVLTQPYYSDYTLLTVFEQRVVRQYNDFQVRYRELLYDSTFVEITESHVLGENREFSIEVQEVGTSRVSFDGEAGTVWAIVHRNEQRIVVNLINLVDQIDSMWNTGKQEVTTSPAVRIQIPWYAPSMRIFVASPDTAQGDAQELSWTEAKGPRTSACEVVVENLMTWSVLWVELYHYS